MERQTDIHTDTIITILCHLPQAKKKINWYACKLIPATEIPNLSTLKNTKAKMTYLQLRRCNVYDKSDEV